MMKSAIPAILLPWYRRVKKLAIPVSLVSRRYQKRYQKRYHQVLPFVPPYCMVGQNSVRKLGPYIFVRHKIFFVQVFFSSNKAKLALLLLKSISLLLQIMTTTVLYKNDHNYSCDSYIILERTEDFAEYLKSYNFL